MLAAQGWQLPASEANFLWLPLGSATDDAVTVFARHGVMVRPFSGEGFCVSIGTAAANDALLAAAADVIAAPL